MCIICDGSDLDDRHELELHCDNITAIPDLQTSELTILNVNMCYNLTRLGKLPLTLIELYCSENYVAMLPDLPNILQILYCGYSSIVQLPRLPLSLRVLGIAGTQIKSIPELPLLLEKLDCSDCDLLTYIGELPDSLVYLDCSNCTSLIKLPQLPRGLECLNICNCSGIVYTYEWPSHLAIFDASGCTWIELGNISYERNILSLSILQRHVRAWVSRRRIQKRSLLRRFGLCRDVLGIILEF